MSSHNSMFQSYSVLQNISLPSYALHPADDTDKENKPFCGYDTIGGVLSESKFVWNANGSLFTVYDVKNGTKIAAWNFGSVIKSCTTIVSCVVELPRPARKSPFLIIGLQRENHGQICIFNIRGPKVLRCIEINEKVTSLCVVGAEHEMSAFGMYLRGFDGVVAVGTSSGNVYLIDVNRLNCEEACLGFEVDVQDEINPCQLQTVTLEDLLENNCENMEHSCILLNDDESEIERFALRGPKNEVCVFVTKDEVEVSALHYCSQLGSLLVGFNFGAWQIWDLINMKLIYTSPVYQENIPVSHFGVQEPCDDPRAFCYIWTIYSNTEPDQPGYSLAVLYSLNFEKKEFVEGCGFLFKKFNSCSVCFQMDVTNCQKEMEVSNALIRAQCIKLQTINKKISRNFFGVHQDETVTVCSIVWNVWNSNLPRTCKTYLTLFDLNQWYKELMPGSPNPKDCEAYLTHVCLTNVLQPNDNQSMLDLQINSDTIIQFTGSQKLEEHYYPSSLAFQIIALGKTSITIIDNQGNQRALLASLESDGPSVLLKPNEAFLQSINFGLIPLFVDMPDEASIEFKRKFLLSVALEQKLLGWLCKCVCTWSSGVYENTGCSLNFLLSWGWQRAQVLKENINRLSVILFDYSGLRLDANTHNLLNHCLSQLKNITTLFKFIQKKFLCFVLNPDTVRDQCKYLEMASTHLEVLDWLLNVGLLPEYPECDYPRIDPFGCTNVPYRVNSLNKYYDQRRSELNLLAIKQFSSRDSLLLIDNLIDAEFGGCHLLKQWNVVSECTVYPPQSLQALMRTYLVENVSLLQKHFVVAYLLLDISATLDHEHKLYESIIAHLLKFPAVFHLSASVTKIIQSFWQLDHGNFQAAVEQLLDPMISANDLKLWHHKVILKALLAQGQYNLALTYFQVRQPAVTEVNDLCTIISLFVANNLIDDAFRFQRQNQSSDITSTLLHHFFKDCDKAGNLKSILVLRLTKEEEDLFIKYLNEVNHPQANELKICYYTQHTRYVDAMQVYDKTGKIKAGSRGLDGQHDLSDTDNIINKLTNFCNPFKKSIIDRLTKKDLNVLKVSNPQPFSVFVHNTEEQVKYKSSVIEAALVKAKETWNQTSTRQNVTKSIIYDDIPFLNTPRAISSVARISSPIIYPKLTSLKDEDNPLLPPKRFKPMSRLTISTVDNNYDWDITCKKLSVRLEMPVVKRKLSKNIERHVVQEVNTETPQSILKSQTHIFSTSSRGDDNILTSDSIKDNRSSISSDRNTPYKSRTSLKLTPRGSLLGNSRHGVRFSLSKPPSEASLTSTSSDSGFEIIQENALVHSSLEGLDTQTSYALNDESNVDLNKEESKLETSESLGCNLLQTANEPPKTPRSRRSYREKLGEVSVRSSPRLQKLKHTEVKSLDDVSEVQLSTKEAIASITENTSPNVFESSKTLRSRRSYRDSSRPLLLNVLEETSKPEPQSRSLTRTLKHNTTTEIQTTIQSSLIEMVSAEIQDKDSFEDTLNTSSNSSLYKDSLTFPNDQVKEDGLSTVEDVMDICAEEEVSETTEADYNAEKIIPDVSLPESIDYDLQNLAPEVSSTEPTVDANTAGRRLSEDENKIGINIYDLSEDDDYEAVDPKLNLSDVSNDLTLNEAMCIVDDNILEIESNSNYIADSDEVFGDKSEVLIVVKDNVTDTASSNEHKNNIEVEDVPEGKAESEGLLKHSSSDVEVIELSSSIDDDVYSSDDENIFTSENGSSAIPTDSEESIPSNSTSNDIDDRKISVHENTCVNTVEEAPENIEVTNLSENPILLDSVYDEEVEDEPQVNNSQIIVPSDLRKSECEANTIVIHVDSFDSKDTVEDSEKVIETKSVEGEQNVNELDSAEQQAEEIASSSNKDYKLNEFVRSSDTNSHVIIPEKSIFDDSVNITPNREMNSLFDFNKDISNNLFVASTPSGSIMFNDQSYDSDILDKTVHHTPGNWSTLSDLLITPANQRQIVNQTNTTDYFNDAVEETPPKSSNNSKIDDWFDTPVKRSQRLSSLQATSTAQTSDLRKYTLRKRSLSTSQVNTNIAPLQLKQSPIKIVKKQVPSKKTRSSSTNAPLSASTRSKRGGSVDVELLSEKLPKSNKKVSPEPSTSETKTKITSRKSKSAVVSNEMLEVYSSTRRLTRRQANLLRKNLGTDISELQKLEKEGSNNSDDSDHSRERGPDIAEMDAIKLLDKKSFEGDPDPDEELVHKSPVSSLAESPIGLRLRSKSSLSNVSVCSEKSSGVGETKRRNVKRRLPGGDASLETLPQSKSPESKSKNVPRKLRKTRANSKDTDISESSTISQAHSVVEAKKPGRITRRTRSTEENAQPRLRRHERSILSKSNLPNIVEEYTGPNTRQHKRHK